MTVQLEIGHIITLVVAFVGCVWAIGKLLLVQGNKSLDQRFAALDKAREEGQKNLAETLQTLKTQGETNALTVGNLERDFLRFKAELPNLYVRREDYVRGQTVLEAKQDALYSKLEVVAVQVAKLEKGAP